MSNVCAILIILVIVLVIPISLITMLIRYLLKKSIVKVGIFLAICVGAIVPLTIIGTFTDPSTWCEHDDTVIEEIASTCTEKGSITYLCGKCEREKTEKLDKLEHNMQDIENGYRCSVCGYEKLNKVEKPKEETVNKEPEPKTEEVVEEEKTYIEGVDFDEIYRAYEQNELRADDAYKGNRYRITAKINGMSTDGLFNLTGGATLTMEKRVDNTIVFFYAEFEREQEDNLRQINVGDTITFEGECLSSGSWVDCEIITE